jgi:methyltransferase of ATP-grasp peptide maturase system
MSSTDQPAPRWDRSAALRHRLADALQTDGALRSPPWRAAVEAVPREVFLPEFFRSITTPKQSEWEPITPEHVGAEEWLDLVYTDETWVTQLDHAVRPTDVEGPVPGAPTSSSTLPGLVVRMLEDLQVDDHSRVLEIGTGTGYSAALASHRLGTDRVTSVEVDPNVAARAAAALGRAGYGPHLVIGDGLAGAPAGAPYDRVIATCAVRHVPPAWIAQTRPGGLILTTLFGWLDASSGLVRLEVTGEGTARGQLLPGTVSFMMARPHEPVPLADDVPAWVQGPGAERRTDVGPDALDPWTGWASRFVAQLAAPTAQHLVLSQDGGPYVDYLIDQERRSFAALLAQPDGGCVVRQSGPVALWDAVEGAVTNWRRAGSPDLTEFEITVTPAGQRIWVQTHDGPLGWDLPWPTPPRR